MKNAIIFLKYKLEEEKGALFSGAEKGKTMRDTSPKEGKIQVE